MDEAILKHYHAGRISQEVARTHLEDPARLGAPPLA